MGLLDKVKAFLSQHDEQVDKALDKAGEAGKRRYAGHDGQIDRVIGEAKGRTGAGDTTQAPAGQGEPPAGQGEPPAGQGEPSAGQGEPPAGQGEPSAGQGEPPAEGRQPG